MTRWSLSEIMALALKPTSTLSNVDPDLLKFNQRLVDKLKYCKEVLVSIRTASASGLAVPEENDAMGAGMAVAPGASAGSGVSSRASKASLR